MANILVTGSSGFIGFHVSKRLLQDGHRVVGIDAMTRRSFVNWYQSFLSLKGIYLVET